ncbi:MAG: ubiquitin-conjugating enzyme E2 S [Stictis urceolatum]|nr:ubiquitin-conjugating enzyme E2 S [Stictis urceolata]
MNSASFRRLAKDHAALHNAELPPYYLFAPSAASGGLHDDLTQLTIHLTGPQGTPYADGIWRLHLKIPQDYPKSPPKAYFKTKIWHPNVEESTGSVCLDTLKRDWQSKLTLRDILITISCLLINPNPDSALNAGAGKLLQEDWDSFSQHARLMTSIHASIPSNLKQAVSEAKRRGEDTPESQSTEPQRAPQQLSIQPSLPQPTAVHEDPGSEDEEENTKENDSSLSPSPIEPFHPASIRRPTVLGKRPLGELPTPEEPPSEDESESVSCSARNIAANTTPQLSSSFTNLSFSSMPTTTFTSGNNLPDSTFTSTSTSTSTSTPVSRRSPKLMERVRGTNFAQSFSASFGSDTASRAASCGDVFGESRAKRQRSDDGKENENGNELVRALSAQPKPAPLVGLGLKSGAVSAPTSRKSSAAGGGGKPKARIGMRRL